MFPIQRVPLASQIRPAVLVVGVALVGLSLMAGGISFLIGWDLPAVAGKLWTFSQISLATGVGLLLAGWASDQLRAIP